MDEQARIRRHIEEHEFLMRLFVEDKVSFAEKRQQMIYNNIESCSYADMEKLLAKQKMIEQHFPEI
ncbi:MAG: hypothetical protein HY885_05830 [Deltaproteobacteria bacterium]|nr:hypothetical protein [Deltaproteobacteria bacterium]